MANGKSGSGSGSGSSSGARRQRISHSNSSQGHPRGASEREREHVTIAPIAPTILKAGEENDDDELGFGMLGRGLGGLGGVLYLGAGMAGGSGGGGLGSGGPLYGGGGSGGSGGFGGTYGFDGYGGYELYPSSARRSSLPSVSYRNTVFSSSTPTYFFPRCPSSPPLSKASAGRTWSPS